MSSRPSKHFEGSRQLIYQLNANLGGEGTVMTEKYTRTHTPNTHTPTSYVLKIQRECSGTDEIYNLRLDKICTHTQTEPQSVIFRKWKLKLSPQPPPHNKEKPTI